MYVCVSLSTTNNYFFFFFLKKKKHRKHKHKGKQKNKKSEKSSSSESTDGSDSQSDEEGTADMSPQELLRRWATGDSGFQRPLKGLLKSYICLEANVRNDTFAY